MATGYAALLGHPVGHSVSPAMHDAAFAHVGLDWRFLAFDVLPAHLGDAVRGLRALGFGGVNVTVPHKQAVVAMADHIDDRVRGAGACNCLRFAGDKVEATNTDVPGFIEAIEEAFGGGVLDGASVVVVGAGGAARAVLLAALERGAGRIVVLNRSRANAQQLVEAFPHAPRLRAAPLDHATFTEEVKSATVVIQTTTAGMAPHTQTSPITWPETLPAGLVVFDAVYNPRRTRFMHEAAERGARVCDGLGMLVAQGAHAFEFWTGEAAPRQVMRVAAEAALTARVVASGG